ncbi:unnamed protein product [Heligmosomoides polygyrus]|uniref:UL11 n=1 Tax=Heligmosomoides polygyrus TaxID=6339 RepID=A0A183FUB3_HELPZ|nr:unnamed protein product [Heligmosomoides polygyrus]
MDPDILLTPGWWIAELKRSFCITFRTYKFVFSVGTAACRWGGKDSRLDGAAAVATFSPYRHERRLHLTGYAHQEPLRVLSSDPVREPPPAPPTADRGQYSRPDRTTSPAQRSTAVSRRRLV